MISSNGQFISNLKFAVECNIQYKWTFTRLDLFGPNMVDNIHAFKQTKDA